MPPETVEQFDLALSEALSDRFPQETLSVDHRIFAIVLWTR
jgi:hypothetical protein